VIRRFTGTPVAAANLAVCPGDFDRETLADTTAISVLSSFTYDPFTTADRSDTQPTWARWEAVLDFITKRHVLGGTKSGNGVWALAWVDTTIMELPGPDDTVDPEAAVREQLLREVDRSGDIAIDLT